MARPKDANRENAWRQRHQRLLADTNGTRLLVTAIGKIG
jgi:hypothetical protein